MRLLTLIAFYALASGGSWLFLPRELAGLCITALIFSLFASSMYFSIAFLLYARLAKMH